MHTRPLLVRLTGLKDAPFMSFPASPAPVGEAVSITLAPFIIDLSFGVAVPYHSVFLLLLSTRSVITAILFLSGSGSAPKSLFFRFSTAL